MEAPSSERFQGGKVFKHAWKGEGEGRIFRRGGGAENCFPRREKWDPISNFEERGGGGGGVM